MKLNILLFYEVRSCSMEVFYVTRNVFDSYVNLIEQELFLCSLTNGEVVWLEKEDITIKKWSCLGLVIPREQNTIYIQLIKRIKQQNSTRAISNAILVI